MAGNIIPAIATTNAITAGIVVMRAFRVLQEEYAKCQSVYVRLVLNPRNQLFVPEKCTFEALHSIWNGCKHIDSTLYIYFYTQLCNHQIQAASSAPTSRPSC